MSEQDYIEVARGLWRAALYYRRLPPEEIRLGRGPCNSELVKRFVEASAQAAEMARGKRTCLTPPCA